MSDAGYVWKTMAAAALGIALFCGGYAGASLLGFKDLNLMSNFMATPLYALPLIVALFRFGRIGFTGVLMLLGGITAAHFLATTATLANYEMGPIEFCEFGDVAKCKANYAREKAAHDPI